MLEDEWPGLFAMTLRAGLVRPTKQQTASRFKNVAAVRIVALHAIHPSFRYRMVLRQTELGMSLQMAGETGSGIAARIESSAKTHAGTGVFAHTSPVYYRVTDTPHIVAAEARQSACIYVESARAPARHVRAGLEHR
jgi:hypothetical protein